MQIGREVLQSAVLLVAGRRASREPLIVPAFAVLVSVSCSVMRSLKLNASTPLRQRDVCMSKICPGSDIVPPSDAIHMVSMAKYQGNPPVVPWWWWVG